MSNINESKNTMDLGEPTSRKDITDNNINDPLKNLLNNSNDDGKSNYNYNGNDEIKIESKVNMYQELSNINSNPTSQRAKLHQNSYSPPANKNVQILRDQSQKGNTITDSQGILASQQLSQNKFNSFAIKSKLKRSGVQDSKSDFNLLTKENLDREKKVFMHFQRAQQLGSENIVRTVVRNYVNNLESRRKKLLNQDHLQTLGDRAIYIKHQIINRTFSQYIECCWASIDNCFGQLCGSKPFHPFNLWNFWSQIIESITIITCLFMYTLFSFYDFFIPELFFYLGIASCSIFLVGTFLRLNTAYFEQGQVVSDRALIIKKYRQNLLFYDIVGFTGMIYQIFVNDNSQLAKVLCFLLILKYKVYLVNIDKIEERMNLTGNMVYAWRLSKLMSSALALCHFVGTAYFFLAFMEKYYLNDNNNWVDLKGFWDQPFHYQYIESFYFALATITLIGTKGDTELETIFCIIVLVLTIGIFATILSEVAQVCEEMAKKAQLFKRDKDILNGFFEDHTISNDLQGQLQNFLKYSYQGHKGKLSNQQFEELMISKFPQNLQELVRIERYRKQVKKFKLLTNFSKSVIQEVINNVQEEYYMPEQIIVKTDQYSEPKLYLVLEGSAVVYQESIDPTTGVLSTAIEGDYFGFNTFFTDDFPKYSIKSKKNTFTTLLTISRESFLRIIQQPGNEKDLEKFNEIKDELLYCGHSTSLEKKCYICHKKTHSETQCNMITYQPNKIQLISKYNLQVFQNRDTDYVRTRPIQKLKPLVHLDILEDRCDEILNMPELRKYLKVLQEYQRQMEMLIQGDGEDEDDDEDDEEYSIVSSLKDDQYYQEPEGEGQQNDPVQIFSASNNNILNKVNEFKIQDIQEVEESTLKSSIQNQKSLISQHSSRKLKVQNQQYIKTESINKYRNNPLKQDNMKGKSQYMFTRKSQVSIPSMIRIDTEDEYGIGELEEFQNQDQQNQNIKTTNIRTKVNIEEEKAQNNLQISQQRQKKQSIQQLQQQKQINKNYNSQFSIANQRRRSKLGEFGNLQYGKTIQNRKNSIQGLRKNSQFGTYLMKGPGGIKQSQQINSSQLQVEGPLGKLQLMLFEMHQNSQEFQEYVKKQFNDSENQEFVFDPNEFFIQLDKMQKYEAYLVHNNYDKVIQDFKKYWNRQMKKNGVKLNKVRHKKQKSDKISNPVKQ